MTHIKHVLEGVMRSLQDRQDREDLFKHYKGQVISKAQQEREIAYGNELLRRVQERRGNNDE